VRERDSRFPKRKCEYDTLEYEAMLLWDGAAEAYERAHKARVEQMFEMLVTMAAR
jgi:hypothetical protein